MISNFATDQAAQPMGYPIEHGANGSAQEWPSASSLDPVAENSGAADSLTTAAPSSISAFSAVNCSFCIPPADLDSFMDLPATCRREVRRLLPALQNIQRALDTAKPAAPEIRRQAAYIGISASTLRRHWYAYIENGDWRVLVDAAKAGPAWWNTKREIGLPPDFIQFWKQLCEENQRVDKSAHRELLRIYRTGTDTRGRTIAQITGQKGQRHIPGYPDLPIAQQSRDRQGASAAGRAASASGPSGELPKGWSYENLTRYSPSDFEKDAMRHGRFAASQHRRQVFTTRVGLTVGQCLMFDDQEYDIKVNFAGSPRSIRPLGFNALDLFSACNFAQAFKPTVINADGTKQKLKQREDFIWFISHVLTTTGYHPDLGTVLVVEHGTAAISEQLESILHDLSRGKITVDRSGLFGAPSTAAMFEGASKGNPRFKGAIESFFNIVRNYMAMLPGQTGLSRDRCPDQLHGQDNYNNSIIRAAFSLPPERQKLFWHPFYEWNEWVGLALDIYQAINARTDHELEGWTRAGLLAKEWRITPNTPWMPIEEFFKLPSSVISAFSAVDNPALNRTRQLSPAEVFNTGAKALQPLPICTIPELIGDAFHVPERTIRNGYITIEDQTLSPDPLRFPKDTAFNNGARVVLENGQKYRTYPLGTDTLILADARNRFVATLSRQHLPTRLDTEAVKREMAAAKKEEAALLAPLHARHAQAAREKTRMHKHNAAVLSGKPITPDQFAQDAEIRDIHLSDAARAAALDTTRSAALDTSPASDPSYASDPSDRSEPSLMEKFSDLFSEPTEVAQTFQSAQEAPEESF